jgi:hypothetical protein
MRSDQETGEVRMDSMATSIKAAIARAIAKSTKA